MDKILEFLRAYFGNVLKMPESELTALFNAEGFDPTAALTAITEKDKARVLQFSGKFQEGINKGTADAYKKIETELVKKHGFTQPDPEHPLQGIDLVDAIITAKAGEGVTGDPAKLTTEDIRKLPAFQPIQREFTSKLTQTKTEMERQIEDLKKGYQRQEVRGIIGKEALGLLDGMNPVLPKVPTAAEKQRSSFLNDVLADYDWEKQENTWLPKDKDGKVVADGHGNALTLESLVKTKAAEWFEFAANNGGGNAGNGKPGEDGQQGKKGYPAGVTKPKTFEEVNKIVNDSSIKLEDRQTVMEVWKAENTPA